MYRLLLHCALATLLCSACSGGDAVGTETVPVKVDVTPKVTPAPTKEGAKLVLVVVLDQLSSEAFSRYLPHLPKGGVLRRAVDSGTYHSRVRYGYAGTNTAPGHASIYTGELPADHGIDSNDIYNYEAAKRMRIINDGKHVMFGALDEFASPDRLRRPTVGDRLHETRPGSKVVSVSLKARAAVCSGGKSPDMVTWYSPEAAAFTTSSYYAELLPPWLAKWNGANPVTERFAVWQPKFPKLYAAVNGKDNAPGEADWHGLGESFPHDLAKTTKPNKIFLVTPPSITYLFDMARTLVAEYKLGQDAAPDLLSISVSSTDYAGHTFGIDSWEYLDILLKADEELTKFVAELEAKTSLSVIITSDHGGTPLAEHTAAKGKPSGRVYADELVETLEKKADDALGKGNWLQSYIQPYLYLHEDALRSDKREALAALISAHAETDPKVEAIYSAADAKTWRQDDNWLKRDVSQSVAPETQAFFTVPAQGHVASPKRGTLGTGHGTPWDSDREVPFLALGVGVDKLQGEEVQGQTRVAATIAALLGVKWHLAATPLPGIAPLLPKEPTLRASERAK